MIGKILPRHGDIAKALRYVHEKEGAKQLPGTGTIGESDLAVTIVVAKVLLQSARSESKKLVFHAVLSLPPEESLTDRQWSQIVERYMSHLGYELSPWCAVRHSDTAHTHVHVVGLRLDENGATVNTHHEWWRSREVLEQIERDYGLRSTGPTPTSRRGPSSKEVQEAARRGIPRESLPRQQIWRGLEEALASKPQTLPDLMRALERVGVRLVPNLSEAMGELSGLRYIHTPSGRSFTGRQLGRNAMLPALRALGLVDGELGLLRAARASDRRLSGRATREEEGEALLWQTFCRCDEERP